MEDKKIMSICELLSMQNLNIPNYQRPYKWSAKNISNLLEDINIAIENAEKYGKFKYRIGTIILHNDKEKNQLNIVDGQQRTISLTLLGLFLGNISSKDCSILKIKFDNKITESNIYYNYAFIRDWFSNRGDDYKEKVCDAMTNILEVVVLRVNELSEAFQLFDSQNARGKALYPHDLLKAYHLRAMKGMPDEMRKAVEKWEAIDADKIGKLFGWYLFPISNWSKKLKTRPFTTKEIELYKGIPENTNYTYAKRAKKAIPYFQITEPFCEGQDFFKMTQHYLEMLKNIRSEISSNPKFSNLKKVLEKENKGAGYEYTKNLFWCALMCYFDRFHNFEEKAVKKLFTWAFMLRIDMERLGYDSINKYAIMEDKKTIYSNSIPLFFKITQSRLHSEIDNIPININIKKEKWKDLYNDLIDL